MCAAPVGGHDAVPDAGRRLNSAAKSREWLLSQKADEPLFIGAGVWCSTAV